MKRNILIIISLILTLSIGIFIGLGINSKLKDINTNNELEASSNIIDTNVIKDDIVDNEKIESSINNEVNEPEKNIDEEYSLNVSPVAYSSNDNKVISELEETYNKIKDSEVAEKFSESAKATFISIVDFIFYNGTIKDVTFNELTDNGKKRVLELAKMIDEKIESKLPNYKDDISKTALKAFISASELIKKGSTNLNEFLKEKLSDENYNVIINSKEEIAYYSKNAISFIKNNGSKLLNNTKDKLSDWYSKYKNS